MDIKKSKLVFTSRLTPKEEAVESDGSGLPVSSEVLFRTTVSNVGGRTWEGLNLVNTALIQPIFRF